MTTASIMRAAEIIRDADALVIGAGAGMGVDSGLPDFRGDAGFWRAYPAFASLGLSFVDLANPRWFRDDPQQAWGFYGHRLNLYRATVPHEGFHLLRRWGHSMKHGLFVLTSNVDGQFERAGFAQDEVLAVHGVIDRFQCARPCSNAIWPAHADPIAIDNKMFRAQGQLPHCPICGGVARPNILMFGDGGWVDNEVAMAHVRFETWIRGLRGRM